MPMRPLQNQVNEIAVFGLTVAFLGFMAKAMRDMPVDAFGGDKSPDLLPATTKEPWQMTQKEWLTHSEKETKKAGFEWLADSAQHMKKLHEKQVKAAKYAGLPVPPEVLKDYPDMNPPQTSHLPQAQRAYREQAHHVIESVQKAVDETKKADSIRSIERILDRSEVERFVTGSDDLREAIADYKGIEREGLTPEEYQEEKEAAFEAIAEAVDGLDIDEDAFESLEEEEIEKPPPVKLPAPNELRRKGIATLDRLIQDKQRDLRPPPSLSDARKAVYKDILNGFGTVQEAKDYVADMPEDSVLFTARGDEISFTLIKLIITDIERNPWLSPFKPERRPDISWQPPLMPKTETYYTVSFQGDTTFKTGEIVSEQTFKAENERVMKLGLRPARGWVTSKGELLSWGNGRRPVKELEEYLSASIPRDDLTRIADKYGWWAAKLAQSVCPHSDVACVEREARRLVEARRARLE